jgi:hypothetical protein
MIFDSNGEQIRQEGSNAQGGVRHRVVHSKRQISPIDLTKMKHIQGDQDYSGLN